MKKILVALDCSPASRRAAAYTAEIVPSLPDCSVTLFAVLTGVPYGEEVLTELLGPEEIELHGDDDHRQELAVVQRVLSDAARLFQDRRFPIERLKLVTKPLRRGIAQDILDEAQSRGCDTIVVGRRGLSMMKQVVLGSVSRDVIQKAEDLAIWVID